MLKSKLKNGRYSCFFILINMLLFILCKNSIAGPAVLLSGTNEAPQENIMRLQLTKLCISDDLMETFCRESIYVDLCVDRFLSHPVDFYYNSWYISKETLHYIIYKFKSRIARFSEKILSSVFMRLTSGDKYKYMAILFYPNRYTDVFYQNKTFRIITGELLRTHHTICEDMNLTMGLMCHSTSFD